MKYIKLAILSIVFLFLVVLLMSLFIPSHIRISKAVDIVAEKEVIMDQVNDPLKWKNWWPGLDTAKPLYVEGVLKGIVLDESDLARPVIILIDKKEENELTARLFPKRMRPVVIGWQTISYPNRNFITLQWYMDFHLRWYPWEKFSSLLLEKRYGVQMEKGLTNLKHILEKQH